MPAGPRPLREGPGGALARALGVTRLARLTGLDRTGVEVASAIRPRAHVLQVTNGKGDTAADAGAGALLEAAELFAAERALIDAWGPAAALAARSGADGLVRPGSLAPHGGEPGWDEVRLAWRLGREVVTGTAVLVPAHAVHVPPADGPWLGPALLRWTSNGMGAAPDRDAALLHALLEAVERDRVARALPDGFTEGELSRRLVHPSRLARAAPRTAALAARIEARGMRVFLLDLTVPSAGLGLGVGRGSVGPRPRPRRRPSPRPSSPQLDARDLGIPAAAALVLDVEGGPVPVAAGYACRLTFDGALRAALLEAAQSRATEIHGAREDVAAGDRRAALALRELLEQTLPTHALCAAPPLRARTPRAAVHEVALRLRRAGLRPVAVELEGPGGVAVVKVLVPGLLLSELL
jgi:ribosomal protein S12 methylthiotransferase accessory factor